jgi:hypothetical protein
MFHESQPSIEGLLKYPNNASELMKKLRLLFSSDAILSTQVKSQFRQKLLHPRNVQLRRIFASINFEPDFEYVHIALNINIGITS